MPKNTIKTLQECSLASNCHFVEWKFSNLNQAFDKIIEICNNLPRTEVIEATEFYWHGVCRSLIFRFPDDLEILKLHNKGVIQIKSSSRIGASDLGVNKQRIKKLHKTLMATME